MLKNILNLDGAQELSNEQKKVINGGLKRCKTAGGDICLEYGIHCAEAACKFDPINP